MNKICDLNMYIITSKRSQFVEKLNVLAVAMNRAVFTETMSLFRSAGLVITVIIKFVIKVMTGRVQK